MLPLSSQISCLQPGDLMTELFSSWALSSPGGLPYAFRMSEHH